jgi:hypothetical protein
MLTEQERWWLLWLCMAWQNHTDFVVPYVEWVCSTKSIECWFHLWEGA